MKKTLYLALPVLAALTQAAYAQDAKAVIAAASKAMGVDGLNSVHYYGTAQTGNLGQNNNANQPWPLTGANDYVRAIDFSAPSSRATFSTYTMTVQGAAATLIPVQQMITPQSNWGQQLDIWTTPWGFLKAAAAATNATVKNSTVGGKKTSVVTVDAAMKSPGGKPYQLVGTITDNLVTRVQTWVENPVFGDMPVDNEFNFYRQGAKGLMYPAQMVQKRGGWPVFSAYILAANANPSNLADLMKPNAGGGQGGPPPAAQGPASEKLADGVYRINGAYNAMAVEMADHVILFEPGPQNEARSQAIFAETRKLFPNKPVRYGVISHHHFDHTGGLENAVAEGITIVTPEVNKNFLTAALSNPRMLAPDALAKSGKKPVIEGFKGDKRVFQDATRTFEIHVMKDLPHADGLVIGWLPKEKILVYADMFNLPTTAAPVPNPPVVGTQVFLANLERLGIQPEKMLSIHTLNPDRLATVQDIRASLGMR